MLINIEMLQHGAKVYTPDMSKLFQKKYVDSIPCVLKIGNLDYASEYKLSTFGSSLQRVIKYHVLTQSLAVA